MPTSRDKESGFALLLVFLMAAIVAISLYSEIPRVAFQSQRQKEQLLVERGEQYSRAIQTFNQATGQYPRSLDDLEKFQNRRFLRHKFVDPMTGKAEWRIIHVGPGGIPTDSLVTKQNTKEDTSRGDSSYVTAYPGLGQDTGAAGQQGGRPQDRRRASEGGVSGDSGTPPGSTPGQPEQNPFPGGSPATTGAQPVGGTAGVATGAPGSPAPGGPANPGAPPGDPSQPNAGIQIQPGIALPGQNPAVQIIQNQLAGPNPRAAQVIQQQQGGAFMSGGGSAPPGGAASAGLGGVGGVASTSEMEGIMVYNDATSYNKWEFLFNAGTLLQIPAPGGSGGPGQNQAPGMPSAPQRNNSQNPPSALGPGGLFGSTPGGSGRPGGSSGSSGSQAPGAPGVVTSALPPVRMGRP